MPRKKVTKKRTRKSTKKYTYARGRRKTSAATLRLYEGKGDNMIGERKVEEIYTSPRDRMIMYKPLEVTESEGKFYFTAKTSGGGKSGQRDAIKLALARALAKFDDAFKKPLKEHKLFTRDPRAKERKKPGLKKARKQEQYSKR